MPEKAKISGPLGIIAGSGVLPCIVADAAAARGLPLHIIGIRGEASDAIERYSHTWIKWGEVGKAFSALEKHGCRDLVIIGAVTRPDVTNVKLDLGAIKNLPFLVTLGRGGDDHLLSSIVRFFEGKGYRVHGADDVAPQLLAGEGVLGKHAPSAEDRADIALGFEVVRALGALDVGQAAVVAKRHVVAIEAAEGTDAMLDRCAELRRIGRARARGLVGVLVKAPKPKQERRVDLPTIGPDTVSRAHAASLAGIALAAGQVLIVERDAVIEAANRLGLFLFGEQLAPNKDV